MSVELLYRPLFFFLLKWYNSHKTAIIPKEAMDVKKRVILKGRLKLYMIWPLLLCILLLPAVVSMYFFDKRAGYIMTCVFVVYVVVAFSLYFGLRAKVLRSMVNFALDYDDVQKKLLNEFELPYALADSHGRLLWTNAKMKEIFHLTAITGKSILSYLPEAKKDILKSEENTAEAEISYNEHSYRAVFEKISIEGLSGVENLLGDTEQDMGLVAVYFFDETLMKWYQKENYEQQMVAGLIYIDNYDEALASVESVRRSLLEALIDRKITKYISGMDGIARKLEKDKYFIAMKRKYVEMLQEDKFSLLDEVKTVNIGNEIAVTLSIGIGINAEKYSTACEYARIAIDLALGRGGDQAVVKNGENISYYGGKSKQVEKNTRVKARVKAHALRELFENNDKVIIMGHKIGDADSIGSAIGIYRAAKSMGKKSHIVINEITTSIRPMIEGFINNSEYDSDMFLNMNDAISAVDESTVVVVVDVNRPSYTECQELLKLSKSIVVLDHHRQSSEIIDNAVLSYIEPYASSASEMVAEILQYIGENIKMRQIEADAMYAGIVVDTNNFMDKTGVRTFEAAAFLRRNGADVSRVRKMFREGMNEYKAKAEVIHRAEIFENSFVISECDSADVESPTIIAAQAANELLNINGMKASFVLTMFNNVVYISARSIDEVNVQVIMEQLGGGGHMSVAGAQLAGVTLEEGKQQLKDTLKRMLTEGDI